MSKYDIMVIVLFSWACWFKENNVNVKISRRKLELGYKSNNLFVLEYLV